MTTMKSFPFYSQMVLARVQLNSAAGSGSPLGGDMRLMSPLTPIIKSGAIMFWLTVTNLIGPLECERCKSCAMNFEVLPPFH